MEDALAAVRDAERLDALRATGLLDSEVEEEFDRLTRLASKLLRAPATFFSLIDADRDFYKSCFGFAEPLASERQMTGVTFCHYSLVSEGALVIPDTKADPLYANVPTVASLGVAAYIGVPVREPGGAVLGSFCAIDFTPRDWSPLDVETMKELAKSAEREVAIRHWMREQEQLIARERDSRRELERVMESRARLIRGFTHDVKNPLGAADGFLALLEEDMFGALTHEQASTIQRVRRSIRTALHLIGELIAIARAESPELVIASEIVDPRVTARDIAHEYRAQAEAKGLQIVAEVAEQLPPLRSDSSRIRQILSNLVSNAVKYTPQGSIRISVKPAPRADDGERIAFAVSDTGVGIAREHVPTLFQEFTRLAPDQAEGAGLGLAISRRLADALGGKISVESQVGAGSTFTLTLPVDAAGAAPESRPARDREDAVAQRV